MQISFKSWVKSGDPWVWLNAGAVAICIIMVTGLLGLIAIRGLGHFWPANVMQATYVEKEKAVKIIGELVQSELIPVEQLNGVKIPVAEGVKEVRRDLFKIGNRDQSGADFIWLLDDFIKQKTYPDMLFTAERREWGNFYGYLRAIKEGGKQVRQVEGYEKTADYLAIWDIFQQRIERAQDIYSQIKEVEKDRIGAINYELERLRLKERALQLDGVTAAKDYNEIEDRRKALNDEYQGLQDKLIDLYTKFNRDSILAEISDGRVVELKISAIVRAFLPNNMGYGEKIVHYFEKIGEFIGDEPREANTEGGIFPAIFGTVLMVLIMSLIVTPFGVVAAIYLREYAKQGFITRLIRIAVNNLAGVPSIVYGVFGLGFFVYFLGGNIDDAFFPEAKPAPTFGTPGLMWASITLALLTVPVVIVATEEGLTRIPRAIREGSLALGATQFETLMKIVIPMASPAIMTGIILAIARAAGEVAPLMLVGVVKLAPSLPLDGNYPFLHLDQKFMHLGFHIYDVGFQSPNVEAARPLVYATALLLVMVIALLNLSAISIRNHLREKYKTLEM